MAINSVNIAGNLTRDAELRTTASGYTVLAFSVAVNDRVKNARTGEWEDRPNYFDCTMFGKRAESISPYLCRGVKVAVSGKLRWSQYEKDGAKRSKVEITVEEIELMSRQGDADAPKRANATNYAQTAQTRTSGPVSGLYDDDIPF